MTVAGSDNFADAPAIGVGETSAPTLNVTHTEEPGEPTTGGHRTAWWTITVPEDGWLRFDTLQSLDGTGVPDPDNVDTKIAVYTGSAVDALTLIASNDDFGPDFYTSLVKVQVVAGTTYRIQVGSYGASDDVTYVLAVSNYAQLGPWMTDADATSELMGEMLPPPEGGGLGHVVWQAFLSMEPGTLEGVYAASWDTVWGGGASNTQTTGSDSSSQEYMAQDVGEDVVIWKQSWATASRTDSPTVTSTYLPFNINNDAEVAAVEWEPTDTAESQYLTGSLEYWWHASDVHYAQLRLAHSAGSSTTTPYDPGFLARADILALDNLTATGLDALDGSGWTTASFSAELPSSVPATGAAQVTVGPLSRNTVEGDPIAFGPTAVGNQYHILDFAVWGRFRPRYRCWRFDVADSVIYDPPYLRNVQRSDGLGFSSAPRAFQNSTQQASLRNFGTF